MSDEAAKIVRRRNSDFFLLTEFCFATELNVAIVIKKYSAGYVDECVTVLAEAFAATPLHLSAFGDGRMDVNRVFFRIGLRRLFIGPAFIAQSDGKVCGYIHFNPSPDCLPPPEEIPRAVATLLNPLGEAVPKIVQWFARWCRLDPDEPHVHLGPIGVSPDMQRRGVGTALMRRYIEHLDQERAPGYLETDRLAAVEFYKNFGFRVQREEIVIGTPVWYMWRAIP